MRNNMLFRRGIGSFCDLAHPNRRYAGVINTYLALFFRRFLLSLVGTYLPIKLELHPTCYIVCR